jgi:GxxExxY protein
MKDETLTEQIIKIFYQVYNELGYGFTEKVYQNALFIALKEADFDIEANYKIKVWFRKQVIGEYYADMVVNKKVILELKAVETLLKEHEAQLLNYLRGTEMEVGLLLNFGKEPKIKRKAYDNHFKPNLNQ